MGRLESGLFGWWVVREVESLGGGLFGWWAVWVVGGLGGGRFGWWAVWRLRESRAVDSRPSRKEKMQGDREWVSGQEPWGFGALLLDFLFSTL